jgi:lipopolysaccharide export system permease protein
MFQSFKLSEYIIVHGAQTETMVRLVFYIILGYIPILFPIALLFAVLMTYGRLSGDSEIVALKALGLTPLHIVTPAIVVGSLVTLLSLQTSFGLAPWGHRRLDELVNRLAQTRPGASIREGVFSEGFFDLVVYANKVDSKKGELHKIFIYDERNANSPMTIIAREGQLLNQNTEAGQQAFLRLIDGDMHRSQDDLYTKIDFRTYDINLFDPHEIKEGRYSPDTMNMHELNTAINSQQATPKERINLQVEWHRRWSLSIACFIFSLLGVGLGTVTNRRAARSGTLVICISAIVIYWTFFVGFESIVRAGHLPASIGSWMTNLIFLTFSIWQYRKIATN